MNVAPSTAAAATEPVRFRDALRDNGLATAAMVLVVAVAVAGWSASFISLHGFAMAHMGLTARAAWLVPSTFDGAALGLSLLSFRAAIYGRASLGSTLYVYGFTGLSSWINWVHIDDHAGGKLVASLLPIAAVLVFGKVLKEAREAFERRHGKQVFKVRPGLLALRWLADRRGTRAAIRTQILDIPVEALIGLGAGNLARQARESVRNASVSAPASAPGKTPDGASEVRTQGASAPGSSLIALPQPRRIRPASGTASRRVAEGASEARLREAARRLDQETITETGLPAGLRQLQRELGIGQARATELRAWLAAQRETSAPAERVNGHV